MPIPGPRRGAAGRQRRPSKFGRRELTTSRAPQDPSQSSCGGTDLVQLLRQLPGCHQAPNPPLHPVQLKQTPKLIWAELKCSPGWVEGAWVRAGRALHESGTPWGHLSQGKVHCQPAKPSPCRKSPPWFYRFSLCCH